MKFPRFSDLALVLFLALSCAAALNTRDDLRINAASHVIYSYPGVDLPSSLLDLTKRGKVGGVILFSENVSPSLPSTIDTLQAAYLTSPGAEPATPLLILTDQEGGEVNRLSGGPVRSAKDIGQSPHPRRAATTAGVSAARTLASNGVNGNLAPVLDVYRHPGDFTDQYERSFANTSSLVATCAAAWIAAQQCDGVVATAKHFPGLGAAAVEENTDERPVTLDQSLDELRAVDMAPYAAAIDAGVAMVMPSWAVYPALDAERPAGLSAQWIREELRGRLGFMGVTVSDAIEAGGLEGFGVDGARGVLASEAGMDLILAAEREVGQGEMVVDALAEALADGTLDGDAFKVASERILNLRRQIAS